MPAQTYWELLEEKLILFRTRHNFFKNSFFQSTVIEWNKLDPNLRSITSLSVSKKNLLKFIRPSPNSVFNCHNCKGIKYLTRLPLGLSQLHEHKFKLSFQNNQNPFCSCALDVGLFKFDHLLITYTSLEGGRVKKKLSNIMEGELFACTYTLRSSHQRCSTTKAFLKNFTKLTGKHASGLGTATL